MSFYATLNHEECDASKSVKLKTFLRLPKKFLTQSKAASLRLLKKTKFVESFLLVGTCTAFEIVTFDTSKNK